MPRPRSLTPEQMVRAADLYREGKSRRQVAAILRTNETAVTTSLRYLGVPLRNRVQASADSNRSRTGHLKRTQLITSVFDLGSRAMKEAA